MEVYKNDGLQLQQKHGMLLPGKPRKKYFKILKLKQWGEGGKCQELKHYCQLNGVENLIY